MGAHLGSQRIQQNFSLRENSEWNESWKSLKVKTTQNFQLKKLLSKDLCVITAREKQQL